MRKKRRQGKKNMAGNIVLGVATAVFFFSAYKLIGIYSEYHKGNEEYKQIVEEVVQIQESKPDEEQQQQQPQDVHHSLKIDFEKLQKINKDVVAWIQFDEPEKISYPVVKGADNEKYLTTTFEGKTNSSGAIFMDMDNMEDFSSRNTFIYGHNMKNGSMFGQLRKYKTKDFCEEHPFFYLYTPDGKEMKYRIFAVSIVEDVSRSYTKHYENEEQYLDYLMYLKSISRYDTGVEVTATSRIISLSTCTNVTETQRLLVHGVAIDGAMAGE